MKHLAQTEVTHAVYMQVMWLKHKRKLPVLPDPIPGLTSLPWKLPLSWSYFFILLLSFIFTGRITKILLNNIFLEFFTFELYKNNITYYNMYIYIIW